MNILKNKRYTMDLIETSFGRKDSELQNWTYNIPEGYEAIIEGNKVIVRKKGPIFTPFEQKLKEIVDGCMYCGGLSDNGVIEFSNQLLALAKKEFEEEQKDKQELSSEVIKKVEKDTEDKFLKENITEDMISEDVAARLQKCGWYVMEKNDLPIWRKIPLGFVSYQHHMEPTLVGVDEVVYKGYMLDKNEFSKLKNLPFDY